jgi:hypothetical protein
MSPLTAELKCPHERGTDNFESEAVTEVSGDDVGRSGEDNAEGGSRKDWTILPASQADLETGEGRRGSRGPASEYREAFPPSSAGRNRGKSFAVIAREVFRV